MKRFAIAIVLFLAGNCFSADMYKCAGPQGIAYRETPCLADEQTLRAIEYDKPSREEAAAESAAFVRAMQSYVAGVCAFRDVRNMRIFASKIHDVSESIADYQELLHASELAARADPGFDPAAGCQRPAAAMVRTSPKPPPASQWTESESEPQSSPAGYQCAGNGRTWIQAMPCPDSIAARRLIDISGHDQNGQQFIGTGVVVDQAEVQQNGLSHDELCEKLRQRTPTSAGDKGSSSVYERNKLRQQEGC